MKTIKIKLSDEAYSRLIAYTAADNYKKSKPKHRTCVESAEYIVSKMTKPTKVPFCNNKKAMSQYYKKLKNRIQDFQINP